MGGRELTASLGEAECILDAQQDGAPSLRASRIVPLLPLHRDSEMF